MDPPPWTVLLRTAELAGYLVMDVYRGDIGHRLKGDDSPVTEADLRADACIRRELARACPGVPVWSEESQEPIVPASGVWPAFFLVDPLDGTKEFLRRNGEFTVNIAWIVQGRVRAGVVHAPALGLTWWGGRGLGAWRKATAPRGGIGVDEIAAAPDSHASPEGQRLHVAAPASAGTLRVLASRSHADARLEGWLARLGHPVDVLQAGSSLKFCRIAEGAADLYPRFGPTSQWDTAAGQAVLEGAGGDVTDLEGRPLQYGLDRPVINPDFVAARDLSLWRATLPAASRHRS